MLQNRVIPILLLKDDCLVKTVNFGEWQYVGDPANTVRIFNELEVDELVFLDIDASKNGKQPNYALLKEIANECFMPLGYGGGVSSAKQAAHILEIGFEKIAVNSNAIVNPRLISEMAEVCGNQAIIASIDYRMDWRHRNLVHNSNVRVPGGLSPVEWAQEMQSRGAGEILLTAVDREGTWQGFDLDTIREVVDAVSIPVIAHGGAGSVADIAQLFATTSASAAGLGSLVVYQKKGMGVLVNMPV